MRQHSAHERSCDSAPSRGAGLVGMIDLPRWLPRRGERRRRRCRSSGATRRGSGRRCAPSWTPRCGAWWRSWGAGWASCRPGCVLMLCRDYVIDACSAGGVVPCRTPEQGCLDSLESAVARWFTSSTVRLRHHAADGTGSKCHLAAARCRRGCRSGRRGSWRRWRACCRPQLMLFRPPGRDRAGVWCAHKPRPRKQACAGLQVVH